MTATEAVPVSVIVPYYRGEAYLSRLATTLAGQGVEEVVVVVDGGEGLASVRSALATIPRATVVATPAALGTAGARNFGASLATNEWITFLDQDDWWPEGFIGQLAKQASGDVVAYDNDIYVENEIGEVTRAETTVFERAGWTRNAVSPAAAAELLSGFPMVKLLLRRDAFLRVGGYRPQVYAIEDFDLVWRLLAIGLNISFVREPRGSYLVRPDSITGQVSRGDYSAALRAQGSWVGVWLRFSSARTFPVAARRRAASKAAVHAAKYARLLVKRALRRR